MNKILVVEDDQDISKALAFRLRAAAYEVFLAQDAIQGVALAAKHEPDLILLDIAMPAGSGLTVAKRVQGMSHLAVTPLIFLTASKEPELKKEAMELGAAAYFEKPYDADHLLEAISGALAGKSY